MRAEKILTPEEARTVIDKNMSEKAFQAMVIEYARSQGWLVYRTWTSIHSPKGFPDLTLARADRLVFLECKTEKGKVTMAQREWLAALKRVYGYVGAHVVRPSMWAFIERILRK